MVQSRAQCLPEKMFSRSGSVLLLLCLMVAITSSNGSNTTPVEAAERSLVINNNCGPTGVDREMMAHIKAKVDYIAGQLSQGRTRHIYLTACINCQYGMDLCEFESEIFLAGIQCCFVNWQNPRLFGSPLKER